MTDINPPDPTTPLGQVRLTIGDSTFNATTQSYAYFTDAEINTALNTLAGGSILRACGYLTLQLANSQTLSGTNVKATNFSIATTGKGATLVEVANAYFAQAALQDAADAESDPDGIIIVPGKINAPENIVPNAVIDNWASQWRIFGP